MEIRYKVENESQVFADVVTLSSAMRFFTRQREAQVNRYVDGEFDTTVCESVDSPCLDCNL